jgi:hypothetical protein
MGLGQADIKHQERLRDSADNPRQLHSRGVVGCGSGSGPSLGCTYNTAAAPVSAFHQGKEPHRRNSMYNNRQARVIAQNATISITV